MERELDVVVFGATGFVGRLIAQYLAIHAPAGTRIALAGRSRERVAAAAAELGPEVAALPIVVADVEDPASLAAMARRTKVVLTTVGPYTKYGLGVVGACAEAGTHCCDLNGEVLFHRDSIDAFDAPAKASGATIVHACGFDSIPGDLAVHEAARLARERGLGTLTTTTMHLVDFAGGMSGGTIDALRTQIDAARTAVRRPGRSASDPYALSPDRDREPEPRRRQKRTLGVELSPETGQWSAPFFMGRYNEQVVRRSNALLGWAYGRDFRYRERHDTGRGLLGRFAATLVAAALPAFVLSLANPVTRPAMDALLPKPGEGPSERARRRGRWRIEVHAQTSSGEPVAVTMADHRDPGYGSTAVMIGQVALALAAGEAAAPGVSTPAAALGDTLPDRLRAEGFVLG